MGHAVPQAMSGHQQLRPEPGTDPPPEQQSEQRQRHHSVTENACDPIGEPLNRGLAGLGLFHHGDDPSQGCLCSHPLHLQH
jgi:hypothetical protein